MPSRSTSRWARRQPNSGASIALSHCQSPPRSFLRAVPFLLTQLYQPEGQPEPTSPEEYAARYGIPIRPSLHQRGWCLTGYMSAWAGRGWHATANRNRPRSQTHNSTAFQLRQTARPFVCYVSTVL
ncbi:hypothetical protein DPEC_G00026310 [Dallia pectoralis]|uniref:Uncharacterized protein n=1 Tax=Dallia pectoralis TaxID=75939 RepID=A0ACC2HIA7_DALPE|nr:hypothetical protein DPEC_G00026310 [Dallia pectoralis]